MLLVSFFVRSIVVYVSALLIDGVQIDGFISALFVSFVLSLVNTFVKPFLKLLALPITLLSLGLFSLVINAVMILLVDYIVPGFRVDGFITAMIYGILLSLLMWFVQTFTND